MATVQPYPIPTVAPQAAPNVAPSAGAAGDVGLFGGNQARDMQVAGAQLEKASNSVENIALREKAIADQTRVEGEVNGFISAKQNALYTAPDAFYRLKGEAAINGAQAVTDNLIDLKKEALSRAANDDQRLALGRALDAQITDATNGISRHVAGQSLEWQKQTVDTRLALAGRNAALNPDDPDELNKSLVAAESAGQEKARLLGATPGSDTANLIVDQEKSKIYKSVIQTQVDAGKKRAALALYDSVKDNLAIRDDHSLAAAMKGIRSEVLGAQAANEALAKVGLPPMPSDDGSPAQPVTPGLLHRALVGQESGGRQTDVSGKTLTSIDGAKGAGQMMPSTFAKYAQPGEKIDNAQDNLRVSSRIVDSYFQKYGGDPQRVAVAYFSGEGNVAPAGSPTPWLKDAKDGNGKSVSSYVADVTRRIGGATPAPSQGTPYKGDVKSGYEQAALEISQRTDLNREDKQAALSVLSKQGAALTAFQAAGVKSLKDEFNTTLTTAFLSPGQVKPEQFTAMADRAASLGEQELATRYRLIASMQGTLKNGLQSAPPEQLKMLKELSEGLPKQIIEGLQNGNADLATRAGDLHAKLKQAIDDGLPAKSLTDLAHQAADAYAAAGKPEKAQEVADLHRAATAAGSVAELPPVEAEKARAALEQKVAAGQATAEDAQLYHLMTQGIAHQTAAFAKDPLAAGSALYADVGPLAPIDWSKPLDPAVLARRTEQAGLTSQHRGGLTVNPFTAGEVATLRSTLDTAPPQQQAAIFRSLAGMPAEAIPHVAAALAGKTEGDALSRSYAAALSFYADSDPQSQAVAGLILDGAQRRKDMGDSARKLTMSSDAVQQAMQDKIGSAFVDMGRKVPAVMTDAVESVYLSMMARAGRQGDKLDADVFGQALDAVVGKTMARNGQTLLPPKGVGPYEFDNALRSLSDGDFAGMTTLNGSPVTARKVIDYGRLTNAGKDGQYFVAMPDSANGGAPGYVMTSDGKPYVLDLKPLLERAQRFPSGLAVTGESAIADRRRAPASPTADVSP